MLDRHSEIIAHFIGQFDQDAEQSLFRLQYDAFRAQPRPENEAGPLREVNVHVTSDLPTDKNISGGVRWTDSPEAPRRDEAALELATRDAGPVPPVPPANLAEDPTDPGFAAIGAAGDGSLTPTFTPAPAPTPETPPASEIPTMDIPAPGGVIVFAYQQNIAQDSDLLLLRPLDVSAELAESRSEAALGGKLMTLAARADTLLPGDLTLGRSHSDTGARIDALRESYAGIDPEDAPDGATVALFSQSEGTLPDSGPGGIVVVDGAPADGLPGTLEEALDAHGYGAQDGDGAEGADTGGDGADTGGDGADTGGDGVMTATIVLGASEAGPYEDALQLIEAGGSLLMNSAGSAFAAVDAPVIAVAGQATSFTVISQINVMSDRDTLIRPDEPARTLGDPAPEMAASEGHNVASVHWEGASRGDTDHSGGPVGFAITEIEGDLVLTTVTVQLNLITDNDVIAFQTTFHSVEIGTGGNLSFNTLDQLAFESHFDMILVGGDMQNLVSVSQLNVLLDDDLVVDAAGVGGDIQGAGNLLWNQAEVTWHGIDTAADAVSPAAASALETMAGDRLDFEALKGESLLDGNEVPLLLTVGGNLVIDYRLEQINILADADTVQLFADEAARNGFNPVDVETGDNLLANVASLDIQGTDSTIMATGGVFSDLVIYQAGMYDTDDTPLASATPGSDLASEAVAFLADGMIDDAPGTDIGGGDIIVDTGGGSGIFDTLGGVVA